MESQKKRKFFVKILYFLAGLFSRIANRIENR